MDISTLALSVIEKLTNYRAVKLSKKKELHERLVERLVDDMFVITDNYLRIFSEACMYLDQKEASMVGIKDIFEHRRKENRVLREKVRGFIHSDFFKDTEDPDTADFLLGIRGVLEGCTTLFEDSEGSQPSLAKVIDEAYGQLVTPRGDGQMALPGEGYFMVHGWRHTLLMLNAGLVHNSEEEQKRGRSFAEYKDDMKRIINTQTDYIIESWGKICTAYANLTGKIYFKDLKTSYYGSTDLF